MGFFSSFKTGWYVRQVPRRFLDGKSAINRINNDTGAHRGALTILTNPVIFFGFFKVSGKTPLGISRNFESRISGLPTVVRIRFKGLITSINERSFRRCIEGERHDLAIFRGDMQTVVRGWIWFLGFLGPQLSDAVDAEDQK